MVVRTRLLERLRSAPRSPVVRVVAPPGYGKTVLLAQWVAGTTEPVAWLTVDDLDNSPDVFLTYLAAALDRVRPIDGSIGRSLATSGPRVLATAVPQLAAELDRWPTPGLLVIDDVHRLVDRTCLDALAELIAHLPAGFRIALSGRFDPDLPVGRFRAHRDLLELDFADLALDGAEVAALAAAMGIDWDRHTAEAVASRAEGWAAGIYLALLADQDGRAGHRKPAIQLSGQGGYIADYLASEVGRELADPSDLEILTRTAVIEIVEPGLAEALSGRTDASERLVALARSNLLIEAVSGEGVYRYHNLLREYLLGELDRLEPGRAPELHGRAADWYEARDRRAAAIDHRLRAGDAAGAAVLVARVALATFYAGHVGSLDRWLAAIDVPTLERHPALAVIGGWIHLLRGRADEADRAADIVERSDLTGPAGDGAASYESSRAMLRAIMGRRGTEQALADATVAAHAERPGSPWRANALWLLGATRLLTGDPAGGEEAMSEAIEVGSASGATNMVALVMRARLEIERGDWAGAEADIAAARQLLVGARFGEIVAAIIVHAMAARAALHRGEPELARQELVRSQLIRPLASTAAPWFSVHSLIELAHAYLAASDPAGARAALRDAEAIALRRPVGAILEAELAATRAQLGDASLTLAGSSSLTTAELRLLPALSTYLSFQEIADRLVISRNTVKTQAISIYGKLQASSRSEAVEHAVELGLLEPFPGFRLTAPSEGRSARRPRRRDTRGGADAADA